MFIQYTLKLNSKQYLWIIYTVTLIIDLFHYCAISILLQCMIAIASIKVDAHEHSTCITNYDDLCFDDVIRELCQARDSTSGLTQFVDDNQISGMIDML